MRGEELLVVFSDLAKVFYSIPHNHITRSLRRFQVDDTFINIVTDLYHLFRVRMEQVQPSPYAVRLVPRWFLSRSAWNKATYLAPSCSTWWLTPLWPKLQATGEAVEIPDWRVAAKAFADNTMLLCRTYESMNRLLETVRDFCNYPDFKSMLINAPASMYNHSGGCGWSTETPGWWAGKSSQPWV